MGLAAWQVVHAARGRGGGRGSTHLSFSFQYIVHGESAVCTSVDVCEPLGIRRLVREHLATSSTSQPFLLAPYWIEATLTGLIYPQV